MLLKKRGLDLGKVELGCENNSRLRGSGEVQAIRKGFLAHH